MVMRTGYNTEYPSIYRGVVEDNIDPENLGRCKIRVPSVHGELTYPIDILPWARPIVTTPVSKERGTINLPDKGDIVWVFFEGANRNFPVYLGGTYATEDLSIDNNIVNLYTEQGDEFSYHRIDRVYTLKVGNNYIVVSPTYIHIVGNTSIEGDLNISGNLTVSGHTTLSNLTITGVCNKECDCP